MQKITPFLWFDHCAEDAASFYVSIFPNSKIVGIVRYPGAGEEIHGQTAGSVMTVAYELDGQTFTAINGGPVFKFNEATSFVVHCDTQQEVVIIGRNWVKAAIHRPNNAAGSRIATVYRGRSCLTY